VRGRRIEKSIRTKASWRSRLREIGREGAADSLLLHGNLVHYWIRRGQATLQSGLLHSLATNYDAYLGQSGISPPGGPCMTLVAIFFTGTVWHIFSWRVLQDGIDSYLQGQSGTSPPGGSCRTVLIVTCRDSLTHLLQEGLAGRY
jgi:hypothetical protein